MVELTKQRLVDEITSLIKLSGNPLLQKENEVEKPDVFDIFDRVLKNLFDSNKEIL